VRNSEMKRPGQFDEVMIVNPSETNSDQRVRLMRFHNIPPQFSGYAEPEPYGYYSGPRAYGYYGEPGQYGYFAPEPYGHYGQPAPNYGYYGQVEPAYGYYGEPDPTYGYYGDVDPNYGYYSQEPHFDGMAGWDGYGYGQYEPTAYSQSEPVGYYAEEFPVGNYPQGPPSYGHYGQAPEMVGYGEPEQQYAGDYSGVGYYGEPDYSGYVHAGAGNYNAGCPVPTNVHGHDDDFSGYSRPGTVNASCNQITEQPGSAPGAPDTFKPLW
jgi:hypothetical protein